MSLDKLLVILLSIGGIAFTYWFFLMRKENEVAVSSDSIDVIVHGGYKPEVISVPKGKTTTLNFLRKDNSSCLEEIVLGDFKVRKYLPLNQKVSISITPQQKGIFPFSCGMGMFHGKIVVK
ncbi:MAG TPA: cupredoxin domain-containing protein [Patescibacteria group bacterium]|nr:cupredoxin domain-containing protein [Patescibacteria group bacterium]